MRAARRAVLLLLLVAVPVVFDTGVRPTFALPKLTVAAVGALLVTVLGVAERVTVLGVAERVTVLGVAERVTGRSGTRSRNPLVVPVVGLLLWTAVSAAASPDPSTSVLGARESLNGLLTTTVLALLFVAAARAFDPAGVRTALSVLWFGGGGLVLAYGALQLADRVVSDARLDPVAWVNPLGERAIWSTLGNPNDLAGFLALLLPIGFALLLLERRPAPRRLTAALLALLLLELVATTARGALLAATAAVILLVAWVGPELRRRARTVLAAGALVALAGGALLVAWGGTERPLGNLLRTGEGTTASLRGELWSTAWRMAEDEPVVGVGPDGFALAFDAFRSDRFVRVYGPELLATDAHNLLLTAAATQGFPGLLALTFLLGSAAVLVVRAERRLRRDGPREHHVLLAATGAALAAYLVQAVFNRQDIALDFCFWVLLGLACALDPVSGPSRPEQGGQGDDRSQGTDDESDPGDHVRSVVPLV